MTHQYSQNQKAAIVSLLISMVNIDDYIAYEELIVTNALWKKLEVDKETFELGRALKYEYAVSIVRNFEVECKKDVSVLLIDIIDADGKVDPEELHLLTKICDDIDVTIAFADDK